MEPIEVFDLSRGEYIGVYVGIPADEAVICAHAQSLGDWNTWDYDIKYRSLLMEGPTFFTCGDFTASKG